MNDEIGTLRAKAAFARYYKAERDRNEKCLSSILDIALGEGPFAAPILDILIAHYSRSQEPTPATFEPSQSSCGQP